MQNNIGGAGADSGPHLLRFFAISKLPFYHSRRFAWVVRKVYFACWIDDGVTWPLPSADMTVPKGGRLEASGSSNSLGNGLDPTWRKCFSSSRRLASLLLLSRTSQRKASTARALVG